jgi:hypothetical protein
MSFNAAEAITYRILRVQELTLGAIDGRGEEVISRRTSPASPSIGFHIWHMARSTDRIQTVLRQVLEHAGTEEIWHQQQLAKRWGLEAGSLGHAETGMEMDDETSSRMELPETSALTGYMKDSFAALGEQLPRLNDERLATELVDLYGRDTNVGSFLLNHLSHMDRHLGTIEGLLGMIGLKGSATV